ncbi:hypothetical protein [Pseudanabaena sp. UWO310]|uniref:hypothetical protein n=1 Tax=Pseudanabaena sp. UWO310 TaxID=2480795 RepID=UPI0011586496|nr:hypothetical protein [Pseudanabaena sp. UWO310]TYQ26753.1 hypothetical protein PseudUWO310_16855 [Pseudanabaena sp. UWO310]
MPIYGSLVGGYLGKVIAQLLTKELAQRSLNSRRWLWTIAIAISLFSFYIYLYTGAISYGNVN